MGEGCRCLTPGDSEVRAWFKTTCVSFFSLGVAICARLSLYSSRLGLSDQREIAPAACSLPFSMQLENAPAVYSSLAFLFTARDSVYQISCASCVQLARLSLYSLRLGLSDHR